MKRRPCSADLLAIGNQARPDIFDLQIKRPTELYEEVVEVDERVRILPAAEEVSEAAAAAARMVTGVTGERVEVQRAFDPEAGQCRLTVSKPVLKLESAYGFSA